MRRELKRNGGMPCGKAKVREERDVAGSVEVQREKGEGTVKREMEGRDGEIGFSIW